MESDALLLTVSHTQACFIGLTDDGFMDKQRSSVLQTPDNSKRSSGEECRKEVGYSLLCSEIAGIYDVQWFLL